jgi:hypothetical protein
MNRRKFLVGTGLGLIAASAPISISAKGKATKKVAKTGRLNLSFAPYELKLRHAFNLARYSRTTTPDVQVQQQLFNELLQAENRQVEPWARDMLALLNDPTREPFSNRYITPGLDALPEIQQTGDIFFPGYWLTGLLSGHKSDEAKALVRQWIDTHADLEPALMNKLKENAYWLLRSEKRP